MAHSLLPRVDRVANNIELNDEVLPDYAREMSFRLTARDNNTEAGGVDWAIVNFEVADVGPFVVNTPEQAGDWKVGRLPRSNLGRRRYRRRPRLYRPRQHLTE